MAVSEGRKMIFICTSMYCEAQPFIHQLNLKKDSESYKFEIFKNEEITLIITGIGKVKSAVAVTYLFSKYEPVTSDLFINVGVCGTENKNIAIGTTFICNKIIDGDEKKTFYPDMLFRHLFEEASVETSSSIVNNDNIRLEGKIVDMEASGIYQAALIFLQPHQMFFVKIVSDYLKFENLTREGISKIIDDKALIILRWINEIKLEFSFDKGLLTNKEQELIKHLVENLKLSSTMENQLKQLIKYYKLQYGDFTEILNMYINTECKSKNEGKRYFAELKQKLA